MLNDKWIALWPVNASRTVVEKFCHAVHTGANTRDQLAAKAWESYVQADRPCMRAFKADHNFKGPIYVSPQIHEAMEKIGVPKDLLGAAITHFAQSLPDVVHAPHVPHVPAVDIAAAARKLLARARRAGQDNQPGVSG